MENKFISLKDLSFTADKEIDFDCTVCMEPIELEDSNECLNCEKIFCKRNYQCMKFEKEKLPCPVCKATDGFKNKLSMRNKKAIQNLEFKCPRCEKLYKYETAIIHWP